MLDLITGKLDNGGRVTPIDGDNFGPSTNHDGIIWGKAGMRRRITVVRPSSAMLVSQGRKVHTRQRVQISV